MNDIVDRYIACFILGAVGDTIGFKNNEWEFNLYDSEVTKNINKLLGITKGTDNNLGNYYRYDQFIYLGGYSSINLKGWVVSDDTVLHNAVAKTFLEEKKEDIIYRIFINLYESYKTQRITKDGIDRAFGNTTMKKLRELFVNVPVREKKEIKLSDVPFDEKGGGCGASMRTMCLGLVYNKKKDLDKLINVSIMSSMITHRHPIGYYGGMVSALFTSFAIQNIPVEDWIIKLLNIFKSNKIVKMFGNEKVSVDAWRDYHKLSYDEKGKLKFFPEWKYSVYRYEVMQQLITNKYNKSDWLGSSGIDSVIYAYDCLLYCGGSFERLIYYSALHVGDSDSTAMIACSWYGAIYGMKNIPEHLTKHLEFKDYMTYLGMRLKKNYY